MNLSGGRILLIALSLCWFAANAMGNLVANGNFAGGTFSAMFGTASDTLPDSWILLPPDTASLSDANVVAALPGYADPGGGSQYVAFRSTATAGQDCLNQVISTIAGDVYTISFYAAMTSAAVSNTFLTAEWDSGGTRDTNMGGLLFSSSSGPATNGFEAFTFTEIASSNNTSFFFHATDSSGAILVADLVVTQDGTAPEPAALLLVAAGLAILGLRRGSKPSASTATPGCM